LHVYLKPESNKIKKNNKTKELTYAS
jgi:hypothetical protein